jgi:hypothetical protein
LETLNELRMGTIQKQKLHMMQGLRIKINDIDHLFFGPVVFDPDNKFNVQEIEDVGLVPMASVTDLLARRSAVNKTFDFRPQAKRFGCFNGERLGLESTVIYLPIFFICITGGECDFIFAKPVPTREICEIMNAKYELRLEAAEEIVSYKSICIPVDMSKEPGRKTYFL